jgi:hypothetical protein
MVKKLAVPVAKILLACFWSWTRPRRMSWLLSSSISEVYFGLGQILAGRLLLVAVGVITRSARSLLTTNFIVDS